MRHTLVFKREWEIRKTSLVSVLSQSLHTWCWWPTHGQQNSQCPQYGFAHRYQETGTLLDSSPVVQWKEKQVYALFPFQVFCLEQLKVFQLRSNQEAKMNAINVNWVF